jgi:radical SAM superfamily enzyme YgiQ (UPF0313 family)
MRALLVQAETPSTYWGFQHTLKITGKSAALPPPLGLLTLAALLPRSWELRLHDLHLGPLTDQTLAWADAVLVSGMLAQADSAREVLTRARAAGKRTVVGGPAATTSPESFPEADHVFQGEAEGRLELLVRVLEGELRPAPRLLSSAGDERPEMRLSPVPRFDLAELGRYSTLALQVSRGCPFGCEFCDIIEIFGRKPRLKSAEQVLAELDALHRLGGRGPLFFVDDNFIGNRKVVAKLLTHIAAWQRQHRHPFDLYTEASVDLATEPELVEAMVEAGFTAVFLGIETPSAEALVGAHKLQNLRMEPARAVELLTEAGLEVYAGFIVGFDSDGSDIFAKQLELISNSPISRAMVGLLSAMPGTALWRRLEREGRLRHCASGDQFERPNFVPAMDERQLVAGYRWLLASLFSSDAYYQRCEAFLKRARMLPGAALSGGLAIFRRAVWHLGLHGPRRRHFWRLLWQAVRRGPAAIPKAVAMAIVGEHFIRYTEETVLPRLDLALAEMDAAGGAPLRALAAPAR